MAVIRLDKYLADMQLGTRSQAKAMIRNGRVVVNNVIIKKSDCKIDPATDEVIVDQKKVVYENYEYYLLNKPQGVVSATVDKHYQTVVDLLVDKKRKDLFPVGRLDLDTEGLLLITNDGELCHSMLAPKKHVDKCYFAYVCGEVSKEAIEEFGKGMDIGTLGRSEMTKPAKLEIKETLLLTSLEDSLKEKLLNAYEKREFELWEMEQVDTEAEFEFHPPKELKLTAVELTLQEGKFHQVKRMFEQIDCPVLYLKRISMGILTLDDTLKTGSYRKLENEEVLKLKELYKA